MTNYGVRPSPGQNFQNASIAIEIKHIANQFKKINCQHYFSSILEFIDHENRLSLSIIIDVFPFVTNLLRLLYNPHTVLAGCHQEKESKLYKSW